MFKVHRFLGFAALCGLVVLGVLLLSVVLQTAPTLANGPTVIATVRVGSGDPSLGPEGITVDPERNRIFVANARDNAVYVINGDTNAVVTITHGALITPWGAAYNPNNGRVYVASNSRNSVVVINSATLLVEQEITDSSLGLPDQVVVDAINNLIYVSNSQNGMITVINGANNTIAARFASGFSTPHAMAVDPSRNRLYVTNLFFNLPDGPDYMSVFSTISFTPIARRTSMGGPNGIAVRSVDGTIYVAQNWSDTGQWRVAVVNPTDMTFKVVFPGVLVNGRMLMGTVYSPGSDRVYVNGYGSNTVDIINAATNTLVGTLPVGANPASGIAVNPNTGRVYVANRGGGSVTVIQDVPAGPTPTPTSAVTATPTPTPLCYGDGAEPDNTPATANSINTAGFPQRHNICPGADQDWMKINVTAGMSLTMRTRNLSGGTDTVLYLYAPDGTTLLAMNDDEGRAGPSTAESKKTLASSTLASSITYSFAKAGTYYIMVKDFDPTAYGTFRTYDVLVIGGPPYDKGLYLPVIMLNF